MGVSGECNLIRGSKSTICDPKYLLSWYISKSGGFKEFFKSERKVQIYDLRYK